jgi:hypothetical protein
MYRRILKSIDRIIGRSLEPTLESALNGVLKTGPETQIAIRQLYDHYRISVLTGAFPELRHTGFRVFSQFEEDGKLLFVFAALDIPVGSFVDIGSADGLNSNCANLALNLGWNGVFIDGSPENIKRGRAFYDRHPGTWAYPPKFIQAMVCRENINQILKESGISCEPDLVSIDIDGNDYWVWEALDCINPKVVIIETHPEFGLRSIVAPYDRDYVYPGKHPEYCGASPVAMTKLARKKGYRLVGANNYGFNLIYVQEQLGVKSLPEVSVQSVLTHPRNRERAALFEPIKDWEFVEV